MNTSEILLNSSTNEGISDVITGPKENSKTTQIYRQSEMQR
jgi:hypothetical protein